VIELANEGTDAVNSSISLTLPANVENLILTGTAGRSGTGNALDNTLTGNDGSNVLNGLLGADTLVGGLGDDTYYVDDSGDVVIELVGEGTDRVISTISTTLSENVENLTLLGTEAIEGTGNALNNVVVGNTASNILSGLGGNDRLTGNAGDDTLLGGDGNDRLIGGAGIDFLDGGEGNDTLTDTSGSGCFNGGAGTDRLTGGASAEIYLGGVGNDTLTTGAGNDVILFNKGDGQDTFAAGGTGSDTVSLGGNFAYTDLSFSKSANHLVLTMGTADQITFRNWYAATPSKPMVNLQVIAEAMAGFDAGGGDPLLDQKVENFDFAALAGTFDAARAATPTLTSWALTNALTSFQLAGSDSAAIGGDLAYEYGKNGTLAGMSATAAQEVIGNASFGSQAQTLQALPTLSSGALRLS
jgi:Ca2+-binding RTX toxin-like protein